MTSGPVVVVGPGRVGGSLAAALAGAGWEVELRGRPGAPAPEIRADRGLPSGSGPPADTSPPPTLVFAVPDDALESVASDWAGALGRDRGPVEADPGSGGDAGGGTAPVPVALHTSGVRSAEVLAALREVGYAVGVWHPLAAVGAVDAAAFRGRAAGLAGDPPAVERAERLARAVGARPLDVDGEAHARYHAAAVLASNGLVACLAAARDELARATGGAGSLEDLLPLARSALANVSERGLEGGLTGPVQRGDAETVRREMSALDPDRADLYRRLARELLDLVGDRLPASRRRALRRLLES